MAVTRARNSGIKTGVLKYDSILGGYPPLMPAPTATAGTESASVAFTAISGISTYRAISTPGSITATGSASPISVTGLTAGTGYTFQIRAENSVGNGAYSAASNSVTPTAASAFESIATATPSGTNTVTFSSISSSYKHLHIRIFGRGPTSNGSIRFNGDTADNYFSHRLQADGFTIEPANAGLTYVSSIADVLRPWVSSQPTVGYIDIIDYASTSKNKTIRSFTGAKGNDTGGGMYLGSGYWNSTAAITSVTVFFGNNYTTGTTIALYGIKG